MFILVSSSSSSRREEEEEARTQLKNAGSADSGAMQQSAIWTNTFGNLDKYMLLYMDKYSLQFGQEDS